MATIRTAGRRFLYGLFFLQLLLLGFPLMGKAQDDNAKKKIVGDDNPTLVFRNSQDCIEVGRVSTTMFKAPQYYDPNVFFDKKMNVRALARDEVKHLRVAYFNPNVRSSKQRGTVVIIMGRAEYIELYCDIISYLRAHRYGVLIYDLRGQGISDRILHKNKPHFYDKGYVDDYQYYLNDHQLLMANFLPSLRRPIYLVGHSLGGHVALQVLLHEHAELTANKKYRSPYRKTVVFAPMWKLHGEWAMRPLINTMGHVAGKDAFFPTQSPYRAGRFFLNSKTHSPERFYRYHEMIKKNKSLRLGGVTYQWLRATIASNDNLRQQVMVQKKLSNNKKPFLIFNAVGDTIVDADVAKEIGQHIGKAQLVDLPDHKHALLQEDDVRLQKLLDNMIDFFNQK